MHWLKMPAFVGTFALACFSTTATFAQEPADAKERAEQPPKPRLEISKETTVIDGPLTEDGYVDYLAALNEHASRGVTPENNAVVPLMRALGPNVVDEEIREEFFQKLGMEVLPAEGDYWVPLSEVRRQQAEAAGEDPKKSFNALREQLEKAIASPWSAEQYPVLAKWLAANEKPLFLLAEAAERPRFYMPRVAPTADGQIASTIMLSLIQEEREAGRALVLRAMLRLKQGEYEAAWKDLHTLHRLARLAGQGEILVDALVGIALHHTAVDASATLLHEGKFTAEQLQRINADLAKLAPLPKMSEKFDVGERYFFLDFVTMMARKGPADVEQLGAGEDISRAIRNLISATALDWNLVARRGNRWYDRIVEATRLQSHAERKKTLAKLEEELTNLRKESQEAGSWAKKLFFAGGNLRQIASEQLSNTLVSLIAPAVQAAMIAEERAQTNADLLQVATALALDRAEHGEYPQSLDQLAAKQPLPKDLYTGEPFHYQRTEEGYLLYSVGPNLKDDQGAGFDKMPNHDIVLRQPKPADE